MKFSYFNKPISNTVPSRVATLADVHQLITGDTYRLATIRYRVAGEDKKKDLKSKEFDYATFSGIFTKRGEKYLVQHSGLLALDFDNLEDVETVKIKLISDDNITTGLLFRSPSGNGLKWVIPIDIDRASHKEWFQAVVSYVRLTYSVEIDASGKDVSRACFLCHDPEAYLNPAFNTDPDMPVQQTLNLNQWLAAENIIDAGDNSQLRISLTSETEPDEIRKDVVKVVEAIERQQIDLTKTYSDWRNIGFALADGLREAGREHFHRISRFYPDYSPDECDKQYDHCLNAKSSGITIRTLFYNAFKAGIDISSMEFESNEKSVILPTIPDEVYNNLPDFFKRVVQVGKNSEEKDILLLGTLATLSSTLHQIYGVYGGKKVFANLYLFLIGNAGSGKSLLDHCKELVMPIHRELKSRSEAEKKKYKLELARYKDEKKENPDAEPPEPPKERMLIIPANISASGMYELLNNNEGRGLIFETEGDTLANTFRNKDFGDFSDGFRKAFHHETIGLYRKTNKELTELVAPKLSAVLAGTPRQVLNLIPDAENGLASRFMYYHLRMKLEWKNVFEFSNGSNLDEFFAELGMDFFRFYQELQHNNSIQFRLTEFQQKELNNTFELKQKQIASLYGEEVVAVVRRMGLITFRIAMIFSAIRALENGEKFKHLICNDENFNNAMAIAAVLAEHSVHTIKGLPPTPIVQRQQNQKERFFNLLPSEFGRQDYLAVADEMGLNHKTAEGYLKRFRDSQMLFHYAQNQYRKSA